MGRNSREIGDEPHVTSPCALRSAQWEVAQSPATDHATTTGIGCLGAIARLDTVGNHCRTNQIHASSQLPILVTVCLIWAESTDESHMALFVMISES